MMKKLNFILISFLIVISIFNGSAQSIIKQKPIIQTKYTADPAPMVYRDNVFLYTSHDEDDGSGFKMINRLLYTSIDILIKSGMQISEFSTEK